MAILLPRYTCDSRYGYSNSCYSSRWDSWGRWVAFAVIVGVAFLLFFSFACFNARRRRSHGQRPFTGTGWMAPPPGPPPPNQPFYGQHNYQQYPDNAPPQYTANPQTTGYFGAQQPGPGYGQQDVELQQAQYPQYPQPAHNGGFYQPPPGPPNGKQV